MGGGGRLRKNQTCLHVCLCVKERRRRMSFQINWNTKGSACEHIPTALGHGEKDGANALERIPDCRRPFCQWSILINYEKLATTKKMLPFFQLQNCLFKCI